jgi:hypothetical protein
LQIRHRGSDSHRRLLFDSISLYETRSVRKPVLHGLYAFLGPSIRGEKSDRTRHCGVSARTASVASSVASGEGDETENRGEQPAGNTFLRPHSALPGPFSLCSPSGPTSRAGGPVLLGPVVVRRPRTGRKPFGAKTQGKTEEEPAGFPQNGLYQIGCFLSPPYRSKIRRHCEESWIVPKSL